MVGHTTAVQFIQRYNHENSSLITDFKELKRYDLDVPLLLCLFAKLSLEAHCHAFVTVEETKRQLGQSATSVSYRLLLLDKGTKMKIDNGCEIFLATETNTIFVFFFIYQ